MLDQNVQLPTRVPLLFLPSLSIISSLQASFISSVLTFFSSIFVQIFQKKTQTHNQNKETCQQCPKPKRKHQTQKQWPQIWKHQTQIKSHFETNPKTQNKNLLFRNTKPKSNFIFQTPNPDLDGKIGGQLWW